MADALIESGLLLRETVFKLTFNNHEPRTKMLDKTPAGVSGIRVAFDGVGAEPFDCAVQSLFSDSYWAALAYGRYSLFPGNVCTITDNNGRFYSQFLCHDVRKEREINALTSVPANLNFILETTWTFQAIYY